MRLGRILLTLALVVVTTSASGVGPPLPHHVGAAATATGEAAASQLAGRAGGPPPPARPETEPPAIEPPPASEPASEHWRQGGAVSAPPCLQCLETPAPLDPSPPPPPPPPPPLPTTADRGAAALGLLSFPWQDLGYDVVFLPAEAGVRARTLRVERRIEVYVRPGDDARAIAFDVAHELGHAVDFERLDWAERATWAATRGLDNDPFAWFGCSGCADLETPAGDFAESFATWQVGPAHYRGALAPPPSAEQLAVLAQLAH